MTMNNNFHFFSLLILLVFGLSSCSEEESTKSPLDPDSAPVVAIDRFSSEAGTLMIRTADNGMPAANAAINFDMAPFITTGLGPNGEVVEYYNFDVQSTTPAPIYVLVDAAGNQITGQLNIIDVIPGQSGYNDFWRVTMVTVDADYVANTITNAEDLMAEGFSMNQTNIIVNCPVVPNGSTATKRMGNEEAGLHRGWYEDQVVYYFTFMEKELASGNDGSVPISPIYVCFNINPTEMGGGPPSGFVTESGSDQTHNVVATIPSSSTYSPLWDVYAFDNADFDQVSDLNSAVSATSVGSNLATVNCPVVSVSE